MGSNNQFKAHWWSKTLIGTVLGLSLAYGLVALFAWFGPQGITAKDKVQFNMWMISPIWLTTLSLVYLFPHRRSALLYLGGANLVVFTSYFLLKSLL